MKHPFAALMIAELAPEIGARVELEPEFKFAGEIVFASGKRHLFRNTCFNINPAAASETARDKAYCKYFLRRHGFPVPDGQTFFAPKLARNLAKSRRRGIKEAVAYAAVIGFPVFAKPNDGSEGHLVTTAYDENDLMLAAAAIFEASPVMLVEAPCPGRDYRVVVLGDELVCAYERRPLSVVGDGKRSIEALLMEAKSRMAALGRHNSEIEVEDRRIDRKLRSAGLYRTRVPEDGTVVMLLDNANLSTGGTSVDISESLHPSFKDAALRAARTIGLPFAGVDIICQDATADAAGQSWAIIELNAAPGLDNYAATGAEQRERVRQMYLRIMRFLEAM